jgi:hypothetical protein
MVPRTKKKIKDKKTRRKERAASHRSETFVEIFEEENSYSLSFFISVLLLLSFHMFIFVPDFGMSTRKRAVMLVNEACLLLLAYVQCV